MVNDGNSSYQTEKIFAYKPSSSNEEKPKFETEEYSKNNTRTVSGIVYDGSGTISVKVKNIAGTQNQVTKDLNRLKLSISDANDKIVFS
jgi:hypothetical protein